MSLRRANIDELPAKHIDGVEPALRAVGYELRPAKMRPSVWEYEPGESNTRHRQQQQEELYVVLEGRFRMTVGSDTETLSAGDVVVVPPDAWRQLTAEEAGRLLVVGAPNVADDGITWAEREAVAEGGDESTESATPDAGERS